jgi:hypothetical protein
MDIEQNNYHLTICNTKWLKNGKLRKAILSAFYNISQRNFGILLILWCSFKLWWNFCPNLSRSKFHSKGERSIECWSYQFLSLVYLYQTLFVQSIVISHNEILVTFSFQNPDFEENEYMYNDVLPDDSDLDPGT